MSSSGEFKSTVSPATIRPFLAKSGYTDSLLHSSFLLGSGRVVPLVAFAHPPADARTACILVIEAEVGSSELIASYRESAAPVVLVCSRHGLEWWKQSAERPVRAKPPVPPDKLNNFFSAHAADFAPDAIYRAKTWGRFDTRYQRSFVDLGLMPVVEAEIGRELEQLIVHNVQKLKSLLGWETLSDKKGQWLLKSVFWLVSAKILRDKEVGRFAKLDPRDVELLLDTVANHYDAAPISITTQRQLNALTEIAGGIGDFSNLQLATTESLAYVYENTLISKATRQSLGTHSTPSYLVDYVVGKLAPWIAEIPLEKRNVFEPACGHAAFLVSAMRLLTELLPDEKASPAQRRSYLRRRIHGCDIDEFALEIARLSLSLTDIPNPDGWDLLPGDMFHGDQLETQSRTATVVLANPPFENFSSEMREWYEKRRNAPRHVNKTTEMLGRILPELPTGAVIGIVVPQGFLHSKNATDVRRYLVENFELQEICVFPDSVFKFSDMESAVLVARKQRVHYLEKVSYRRVREREMNAFRKDYAATLSLTVDQSMFHGSCDMRIPDLGNVWDQLRGLERFRQIAEIGQGFTYKGKNLPRGAVTFSDRNFPGAVRGFLKFPENVALHELPSDTWLNLSDEVILRPRHGTTTSVPQIIFNEARSSRGAWRIKALIDPVGHPVTGRFNVVRPHVDRAISLEFMWALCNSPIANAFAFSHSGNRHNDAGMLREMPVPKLTTAAVDAVSDAATEYLGYVRSDREILRPPLNPKRARELLLRMDSAVLTLYALPCGLEWQLLNFFAGWPREGLPFQFTGYFPEGFDDRISLADYFAITADWPVINRRRAELIHKKVARTITTAERQELEHLQSLAESRVRLEAPLPIAEMEHLYREVAGVVVE